MSTVTNHLNHSTWDCQYHVVFTPKYRKKVLYGMIRRDLREVFHRLAKQNIGTGQKLCHYHRFQNWPVRLAGAVVH